MSKAARNRRQRQHRRPQPAQQDPGAAFLAISRQDPDAVSSQGGSPEARELLEQAVQQTEMPCRATYLDDPVFGSRPAPVTGMTPDGELITDPGRPMDQIPVLLFEPARQTILSDPATGLIHDVQTEVMISLGFHRVPARLSRVGLPAEGWGVHRVPGGVALRDSEGAIRAEAKLDLDPEWVSAAASSRAVLVFFGPKLGIRVLPGRAPYTDAQRVAEFASCRRDGTLLLASVAWRGQLDEATKWLLLAAGSLGFPGPAAYVPAWHFRSCGGTGTFGFTPLAPGGDGLVEIPPAAGLVAELTETDFDLVRPGAEDELALITGYHAPPGEQAFAAWRAQALRAGQVFVVAGRLPMPWPEATPEQLREVADAADVAVVGLTPASLRARGAQDREPGPAAEGLPGRAGKQDEFTRLLTDKLRAQDSYSAHIADAVAELIDPAQLQPFIPRLWPVVCQTCEEPLGDNADVSADRLADGDQVLISLHHSVCRPSGATLAGGPAMCLPTSSFAAGYLGNLNLNRPRRGDLPVMVINPSCEQLLLARQDAGSWRDATLDNFAALGLTPASRKLPPYIAEMQAELDGPRLDIRVTTGPPGRHQWMIEPPEHVREQVSRYQGFLVAVTTKVLPVLLTSDDLPAAVGDPEALAGWADLASAPPRRTPRSARRSRESA